MDIKINLNMIVKVRLTDFGIYILKKQHEELNETIKKNGGAGFRMFQLDIDESGYYQTQLFTLIQKFGHVMSNSNEMPFYSDIIVTNVEHSQEVLSPMEYILFLEQSLKDEIITRKQIENAFNQRRAKLMKKTFIVEVEYQELPENVEKDAHVFCETGVEVAVRDWMEGYKETNSIQGDYTVKVKPLEAEEPNSSLTDYSKLYLIERYLNNRFLRQQLNKKDDIGEGKSIAYRDAHRVVKAFLAEKY